MTLEQKVNAVGSAWAALSHDERVEATNAAKSLLERFSPAFEEFTVREQIAMGFLLLGGAFEQLQHKREIIEP